MTDAELQEKLEYWQKRLRLADWYITAKFVTVHELPDEIGNCKFDWETRSAVITLRHRDDWGPDYFPGAAVDDEEATLVHELLHCSFAGFTEERDSVRDKLQHQAVNALSFALVEEHRQL